MIGSHVEEERRKSFSRAKEARFLILILLFFPDGIVILHGSKVIVSVLHLELSHVSS